MNSNWWLVLFVLWAATVLLTIGLSTAIVSLVLVLVGIIVLLVLLLH